MIECSDLFPDAEWAGAHIHGTDLIRINIQTARNIFVVHVKISKIASFLETVRREQQEPKIDRKCLADPSVNFGSNPASIDTTVARIKTLESD